MPSKEAREELLALADEIESMSLIKLWDGQIVFYPLSQKLHEYILAALRAQANTIAGEG